MSMMMLNYYCTQNILGSDDADLVGEVERVLFAAESDVGLSFAGKSVQDLMIGRGDTLTFRTLTS